MHCLLRFFILFMRYATKFGVKKKSQIWCVAMISSKSANIQFSRNYFSLENFGFFWAFCLNLNFWTLSKCVCSGSSPQVFNLLGIKSERNWIGINSLKSKQFCLICRKVYSLVNEIENTKTATLIWTTDDLTWCLKKNYTLGCNERNNEHAPGNRG